MMKKSIKNIIEEIWHCFSPAADLAIVGMIITIVLIRFQMAFMWRNIVVFAGACQQRMSSMYISQIQPLSGNMSAWTTSLMKQLP